MATRSRSLLSNRNFVLLWFAYFISAAGDHLSEMAILKTQDAMAETVDVTPLYARMTFVFFIPFFVFGPLMGYLADRFSRRRLMIVADLLRMGIMAGFAWLIAWFAPISSHWGPFVPLAAVGLLAAMFSPARSALLPTLIHTDELVSANALIRGIGVLATMISNGLGGWLADNYAPEIAFRLDAATFAASAVCVFFIIPPRQTHRTTARERKVVANLVGGFRYVADHRRVRQIFAVGVVFWFSAAAIRNVVPAAVKDIYLRPEYFEVSKFLIFMAGGMVLGAVILATLRDSVRSEIAMTWTLIGAGLATAALTLTLVLPIPPAVAYWCGGLSVAGLGGFGAALIASFNALLQRIVPDRFRGRVYGVLDLCTVGGLLLASGILGIPQWPGLDRWVPFIASSIALLLFGSGMISLGVRLRGKQVPLVLGFVQNLNEFVCRYWYRTRRVGPCTVPRSGAVIVTANHTSTPDPLMIYATCGYRKIAFMVAEEYYRIPVAGWFMKLIECIPVRREARDMKATKEAIRRLRDGAALGIFIEGRIPEPGEASEPKDGVAVLALRTGATVVPVHMSGNRYTEGIAAGFLVRHRCTVRYGKPVDLSDFEGQVSPENIRRATERIFRAIREAGCGNSD